MLKQNSWILQVHYTRSKTIWRIFNNLIATHSGGCMRKTCCKDFTHSQIWGILNRKNFGKRSILIVSREWRKFMFYELPHWQCLFGWCRFPAIFHWFLVDVNYIYIFSPNHQEQLQKNLKMYKISIENPIHKWKRRTQVFFRYILQFPPIL
jgi:hypothetical protein